MSIKIRNVSKRFGSYVALNNISVDVPDGELLALLGPSGSGKTTLLRVIAGLELPDTGTVTNEGEDITYHAAQDRKVGFVFQHYALFKHMTVAENIGYALKVRKAPKAEIRDRVAELLHLIRLEGLQDRYPSRLSGGQRQRVALARALAAQPRVLLFDEPFGALDAQVRQELRLWLRRLHEEIHVTSIFVTHDQQEAFEVADRVVLMNQAKVEQIGTPTEIYDNPSSPFVCSFLGNVNTFHGRITNGILSLVDAEIPVLGHKLDRADEVVVYVRTHEATVTSRSRGRDAIPALVRRVITAGPRVRVELSRIADGSLIVLELSHGKSLDMPLHTDNRVFVELETAHVFTSSGGAARIQASVSALGGGRARPFDVAIA